MNFTEREIAEITGWKAYQSARKSKAPVNQFKQTPRTLSGVFKIKGRNAVTTVIVASDNELEVKCRCDEHYQSGGHCEHSAKLLLQTLSDETQVEHRETKKANKPDPSRRETQYKVTFLCPSDKLFLERGLPAKIVELPEDGTTGNISFSSLNFPEAKTEKLVQLDFGSRMLLLLNSLNQPSELFIEEGGHSERLNISQSAIRIPTTSELNEGVVTLRPLSNNSSFDYQRRDNYLIFSQPDTPYTFNLKALPAQLKEHILPLLEGREVTLSIQELLDNESTLDQWVDLSNITEEIRLNTTQIIPEVTLSLNGTAKKASGELLFHYEDQGISYSTAPSTQTLSIIGQNIKITSPDDERRAAHSLRQCGFTPKGNGFQIEGEGEILEFLAKGFIELKEKGWEIELKGSIRALDGQLVRLLPKVKIDPIYEGDEWFTFTYSFQTPEGQGLKQDDAQRLIQSGKQFFNLKNGKKAILSRQDASLFREVVIDAQTTQVAGKFKAPISQYKFINKISENKSQDTNSEQVKKTNTLNKEHLNYWDKLRDYQQEGVHWILAQFTENSGALLADDMGLGKTVQTISAIHTHRKQNEHHNVALILCPASLLHNWRDEIKRWIPSAKLNIYHGVKRDENLIESTNYDYIITTYQTYLQDKKKLEKSSFDYLVCDEASVLRNPDSQISKATAEINAKHKLLLTGTPLENSTADLWSLFRIIQPQYLGPRKEFEQRFVKSLKDQDNHEKANILRRLRAKVTPLLLRRTKQEVAKDLPGKLIKVENCLLNEDQRQHSNDILKELHGTFKDFSENQQRFRMITALLRLRQISNDPRLVDREAEFTDSPKLQRTHQIISNAIQSGQKVILFSQFTQMLNIIQNDLTDKGIKTSILTGATTDRERAINTFKNDKDTHVFLISLKAGGYGLNLTEASVVIHFDPWWNPAVEAQATDRAYRIGQTKPVSVYKLITENSVEEKILKLQSDKQDLINLAVDDIEPNFSQLGDKELKSLLNL